MLADKQTHRQTTPPQKRNKELARSVYGRCFSLCTATTTAPDEQLAK